MEDMIQIKLAVEGMRTEIVKCFDVATISAGIKQATDKAVSDFDIETYVSKSVESVLYSAREKAIEDLSSEYGSNLADTIRVLLDAKLEKAMASIR